MQNSGLRYIVSNYIPLSLFLTFTFTYHHRCACGDVDVDPTNLKPGELGLPVHLTNLTAAEIVLQEDLYNKYGYNQFVSEKISMHRALPDFRDPWCKTSGKFTPTTPTSIIIPLYNEAVTTFLRTIHSILNRSPPALIHEIIVVDDHSEFEDLKDLEERLKAYRKVKMIRAPKRLGLIKAKLLGSQHASAPIITFLDAHIECTEGWLEPLIHRIEENPTVIATPIVDWINADTLEYIVSSSTAPDLGGFTWDLFFDWIPIQENRLLKLSHPAEPLPSPTNVGGIFSIHRQFFERLGLYDEEYEVWGGENLELSFKAWMCGGSVEYISCSRVGHIYKGRNTYRATLRDGYLIRNLIRLAEVWMDEYKYYFYSTIFNQQVEFGNITDRLKLRQQLNCHSFEWYLENVIPELFNPKKNALKGGEIRNVGGNGEFCIDLSRQDHHVGVYPCTTGPTQHIWYTKQLELRNEYRCLDYDGNELTAFPCHGQGGNQMFLYNEQKKQIAQVPGNLCLSLVAITNTLRMDDCHDDDISQVWHYESNI